MDRRSVLALSGAALAGLAGCSTISGSDPESTTEPGDNTTTGDGDPSDETTTTDPPEVSTELQNPSFEDDWNAWEIGRYLPDDPNREGDRKVATEVGVSTRRASDGVTSLRMFIDGLQDDGTLWVQQPVDLEPYESLSIDAYSEQESFNEITKLAVYTGPEPDDGLVEADFDRDAHIEDHEGWKTYEYPVDHDGSGIVAVGINIIWETPAVRYLDNVVLSEDPPATTTPGTTTGAPNSTTTAPNSSTTTAPNSTIEE